jgi:hypothetical protein
MPVCGGTLTNTMRDIAPVYFENYLSEEQISKNIAEVIILSGEAKRFLWDFSAYCHARFIASSCKRI